VTPQADRPAEIDGWLDGRWEMGGRSADRWMGGSLLCNVLVLFDSTQTVFNPRSLTVYKDLINSRFTESFNC
jgi:hypothetical protein